MGKCRACVAPLAHWRGHLRAARLRVSGTSRLTWLLGDGESSYSIEQAEHKADSGSLPDSTSNAWHQHSLLRASQSRKPSTARTILCTSTGALALPVTAGPVGPNGGYPFLPGAHTIIANAGCQGSSAHLLEHLLCRNSIRSSLSMA